MQCTLVREHTSSWLGLENNGTFYWIDLDTNLKRESLCMCFKFMMKQLVMKEKTAVVNTVFKSFIMTNKNPTACGGCLNQNIVFTKLQYGKCTCKMTCKMMHLTFEKGNMGQINEICFHIFWCWC